MQDDKTEEYPADRLPTDPAWSSVFDRSGPARPAPQDRGPGRVIRILAGVREELLDWVPEERARYTRLGLIVFNTGVLAALSLFAALHKISGAFWLVLLPVCAIWALLVMTFDGWLVASTHGVRSRRTKWAVFVPRLCISILMGAAIAEPLVLWVFQPAITQEVKGGRLQELDRESSVWTACNPTTGGRNTDPACRDHQLSLAGSPQSARDQQTRLKQQRDALQTTINGINAKVDQLQQLARDECSGNSGRGLTGRRGEGPNCRQLRSDVATFRSVNGLVAKQNELNDLNSRITALDTTIKNSADTYAGQVATAIKAKVDEKRSTQGDIGLLDEMAALDRLSDRNAAVWLGQWVLRLLLIAIDCMPVLTKALGGKTMYDDVVADQLDANGVMHAKYLSFQEQSFEHRRRAETEELDAGDRAMRAKRRADTRRSVDVLFAELYAQSTKRGHAAAGTTVTLPRQTFPPASDPWDETNDQRPPTRINGVAGPASREV